MFCPDHSWPPLEIRVHQPGFWGEIDPKVQERFGGLWPGRAALGLRRGGGGMVSVGDAYKSHGVHLTFPPMHLKAPRAPGLT